MNRIVSLVLFSLISCALLAQNSWKQFTNLKNVSISSAIQDADNNIWLATQGGVYMSDSGGESWQLENSGFGKIDKAQSNTSFNLIASDWGMLLTNSLGHLYIWQNERWVHLYPDYSFVDIAFYKGNLYAVGKNHINNPFWFFDADLLRINNLDKLPEVMKRYGSLFFNFSDPLSVAGNGLIVSANDRIEYFDGDVFENISAMQTPFIPRSIVGKSKDDLHAIAFSFFTPNQFFSVNNYFRYNGVDWVESSQQGPENSAFALSQYFFDGNYYQYAIDQTTFLSKFFKLQELPILGDEWVDLSALNTDLTSPPRYCFNVGLDEYLFVGNTFIKKGISELGVSFETRENNIYNGRFDKILLLKQKLYSINNEKLKIFDINSGNEEAVNFTTNNFFGDFLKFDDYLAISQTINDSIKFFWNANNQWQSIGLNVFERYDEIIEKSKNSFVFKTRWDFRSQQFKYFEGNFESKKINEIDFKLPKDSIGIFKAISNQGNRLLISYPIDYSENSLTEFIGRNTLHFKANDKSWIEVNTGLFEVFGKESLRLDNILVKNDTMVVILKYFNNKANYRETRVLRYNQKTNTLEKLNNPISLDLDIVDYKDGEWSGFINDKLFYSKDLVEFEIIDTENIPEGANILSFDFENGVLLGATDGNGLFSRGEQLVSINEISNDLSELYPNPSSDNIKLTSQEQIKDFKIINMQGQVVKQKNNMQWLNTFSFSVSDLPIGVYTIVATTKNGASINKKFVRQ